MESDGVLLEKYRRSRDAEAFAILAHRHAGMVYGTALRLLGNAHDAEEVAQECFLALAREPGKIRTSIGGWLHSLAISRSKDSIKKDQRRLRREVETAAGRPQPVDTPSWTEIAPHIDAAIAALPDDMREAITLHFLGGKPQVEVAEQLGASQATVSRRIQAGIEILRKELGRKGIGITALALAGILSAEATQAAPVAVTAAVGKLALSGITAGSASGAAFAGKLLFAKALIALAALCLSAGLVAVWAPSLINGSSPLPPASIAETPAPIVQSLPVATPRSVAGQVLTPDGKPIPRAQVDLLYCHDLWGYGSLRQTAVETDSEGQFSLSWKHLPGPATFLVRPIAGYYVWARDRNESSGWARIAPDSSRVTVTLHPGRQVVVHVKDDQGRPVAGATVRAVKLYHGGLMGETHEDIAVERMALAGDTDETGRAILHGIPAAVAVQISAAHVEKGEGAQTLPPDGDEMTLKLSPFDQRVTGKVVFAGSGSPAQGVLVHRYPPGTGGWTQTDAEGRFTMAFARQYQNTVNGKWYVAVRDGSGQPRCVPTVSTGFALNEDTRSVQIEVVEGMLVSVWVTGKTARLLQEAVVSIGGSAPAVESGHNPAWAVTDANGRLMLRCVNPSVSLLVHPVVQFGLAEQRESITLTEQVNGSQVVVAAPDLLPVRRMSVKLMLPDGNPSGRIDFRARQPGMGWQRGRTDAEGRLRLTARADLPLYLYANTQYAYSSAPAYGPPIYAGLFEFPLPVMEEDAVTRTLDSTVNVIVTMRDVTTQKTVSPENASLGLCLSDKDTPPRDAVVVAVPVRDGRGILRGAVPGVKYAVMADAPGYMNERPEGTVFEVSRDKAVVNLTLGVKPVAQETR